MAAELRQVQKEEQQQERQCSLKQHQVRTIFVLCCCVFSLVLLPLCWQVLWSPFGLSISYFVTLDVASGPDLTNPEAKFESEAQPIFNNSEVNSTDLGTAISFNNHEAKSKLRPLVKWESSDSAAVAAHQNRAQNMTATRRAQLPEGEKYMWYSPHSGFSNQARELMNALKIAFLLNRTLVLPPVLDHFELKQGTCLGPLRSQRDLRKRAWAVIASRFDSSSRRGYVSIADIIDLSSIKSIVKTIDLRVFLALGCGVDISPTCSGHVCHTLARELLPRPRRSISSCAAKFFPTSKAHDRQKLITEVDDDCRVTIWTNGESPSEKKYLDGLLAEQLQNDTTLPSNINTSSIYIKRKDVIQTLGPASPAGGSFLLAFGTLFSRRYKGLGKRYVDKRLRERTLMVDIDAPSSMKRTASILRAIEDQAFSVDIVDAGQYFVQEKIKEPFFCAHVRLEDGAFTRDQDRNIFTPLQQSLERLEIMSNQTTSRQLNIFVMTDRPRKRWKGTYLHDLSANPNYRIHTMDGEKDLLKDVSEKIHFHEYGFDHGFLPQQFQNSRHERIGFSQEGRLQARTKGKAFDVRLFVEEVVCSCATLGFHGTESSTVSFNIKNMREAQKCPI